MNYLITGGVGFIGSHLIDALLQWENDGKIICFDNFDNFYSPIVKWKNVLHNLEDPRFKLVSGNVVDKCSLEKVFKEYKIDAVVHLAAQAGVRPSVQNPNLHFEVNVLGTVNVLEMCRKYRVKKVVYASSSSVYGNHPDTPFVETLNVDMPLCPYAASKKSAELICYTYHHLYEMDIACVRPFTVYGSRQRLEMAIPLFTKLIYQNEPITVYGNGETRRDYTHVFDVVDGICKILRRSYGYEIYNLGTFVTTTLNELIEKIWRRLPNANKPVINYRAPQMGEARMTFANIDKARRLLGYNPIMNLDKGLDQYIEWFLREEKYATPKKVSSD